MTPDPTVGGRRPFTVECVGCQRPAGYPAYRCDHCGSPLIPRLAPVTAAGCAPVAGRPGIWRHAGLLPRTGTEFTRGEGTTPLIPLDHPHHDVRGKLESLNPTLSFKDRAMALAAAVARDHGLTGFVLASTGNAAVSAAAYAAGAGLRCRVFCARGSRASAKLDLARAVGATVEMVDGDYSDAYAAATRAESDGWLNVTTTYRNPLLAEAYRPIAAELLDDLGRAPDDVIVPVGAGPLLHGIARGFADLRSAGLVVKVPRLVGVQASACAPLAAAWAASRSSARDWRRALAAGVTVGTTAAAAIADSLRGYEDEGLITLAAVHETGGAVVAIDEPAIAAARHSLASQGVLVEPAAAVAYAAVFAPAFVPEFARAAAAADSTPSDGRLVVSLLTGHGAKEPAVLSEKDGR